MRGSALIAFTLLAILPAPVARAHEIGTTKVLARFDQGTYEFEILTDATALAEKIEASAGRVLAPDATPGDLEKLLTRSGDRFLKRIDMRFDQTAADPGVTYRVEPPEKPGEAVAATIRLAGRVPKEARTFTWKFGWTFTTYSLTIGGSEGAETRWLEGSEPGTFALAPMPGTKWEIAGRYLSLGFTHILPLGLDHVLFVLGIYLLNRHLKPVMWQVSAFTLAHSITLGLSTYGIIAVRPSLVEPLIALSIAYVAIENIFLSELKPWRIVLVFAFGLLHGMGFAGVLRELGLPPSEFLAALLAFNLGVEAGQLTVIGAAFLLVGVRLRNHIHYRTRVVYPCSAVIACVALYWTWERLAA